MNDLIFYAILIALLYYFFIYLPQHKKNHLNPDPDNKPFTTHPKKTNSTETQSVKFPTERVEYEPGPQHVKCPSPQVINGPEALTREEKQALENTLDYIMKGMDELSKELEK